MGRGLGALLLVLVVHVSAAWAQTQVRVARDRATIWQLDAPIIATIVARGTLLDVVGREGEWFIVTIPPESGGRGESGRVAVAQVESVSGATLPQTRPPQRARSQPAQSSGRPSAEKQHVAILGFAYGGFGTWLARDTFNAVLGRSRLPMFGGGGQLRARGAFAEIAAEHYKSNGERVFVNDGQVFKLGIADTVRIVPIYATVGYHFERRVVEGYFGAGAGQYLLRERSDFSDSSEDRLERFTSYHALAGVEFRGRSPVRVAFEVQFTTVPDALGGLSGASGVFNERNLGGLQVRVKVLGGR